MVKASGKASVLYISYDCITEPLTQSQVLPYLKGLSEKYELRLMTFNKRRVGGEELRNIASRYGIAQIIGLRYHKTPTIPATIYDIVRGIFVASYIVVRHRVSFVHARSYVACMIAYWIKLIFRTPYLFDIRGLLADERVDSGDWKEESLAYRMVKRSERSMLLASDAIVVLAQSGIGIVNDIIGSSFSGCGGESGPEKRIRVIPTCVDTGLFSRRKDDDPQREGIRIIYVGSIGTWYMLPEMARFFKIALAEIPASHMTIVTRADPLPIRHALSRQALGESEVDIISASHNDVPGLISQADASIFFIRPLFSKKVSCPTKFAESLAMGVPVIANAGIGDINEYVSRERVGVLVDQFTDDAYKRGVHALRELLKERTLLRDRCRRLAESEFSLSSGIEKYDDVYRSMK